MTLRAVGEEDSNTEQLVFEDFPLRTEDYKLISAVGTARRRLDMFENVLGIFTGQVFQFQGNGNQGTLRWTIDNLGQMELAPKDHTEAVEFVVRYACENGGLRDRADAAVQAVHLSLRK